MALTQQQLDERRAWMGATDVARVMTGRAHDVWLEKVFGTVAETLPDNDPRSIGSSLETAVLDWAERRLGVRLVRNHQVTFISPHFPVHIVASCDALTEASFECPYSIPVEAKTSGILWHETLGQWGDEGTDDVPEYYLWQVTTQMLCTNADHAYIAALLAGRGYVMFEVKRNAVLEDRIIDAVARFWPLVTNKTPPDDTWGSVPSIDTCRALARVPGKVIELPQRAMNCANMFEEARTLRLDIEKGEDAAKALLLAALGDAERGVLPDGRIVERKVIERKGYTVEPGETVRLVVRKPNRKELE